MRGTEQLSARDVEVALDAIARGRRCPADNLPSIGRAHRTPAPELESVIDLMYALIRLVSDRSGVATSLIISRDGLLDYIDHPGAALCARVGASSSWARSSTIF